MVFGDQHDDLVCVAHAAHGDVQPVGDLFVEHAQAIVGVGQAKSATAPAQPRGGLQHDPFPMTTSTSPAQSRSIIAVRSLTRCWPSPSNVAKTRAPGCLRAYSMPVWIAAP